MNEFIVWDKKNGCFFEPTYEAYKNDLHYLVVNQDGELLSVSINNHNNTTLTHESLFYSNFTTYPYIGKTDINNEKIYADCSIVEFDYVFEKGILGGLKDGRGYQNSYKLIGYFSYCAEICSYYIDDFKNKSRLYLSENDIENLKIIDTIQENKLGLIK